MTGNATAKAKLHAFSQITMISSTRPTLKTLMTNDIKQDMNNAMKNANT